MTDPSPLDIYTTEEICKELKRRSDVGFVALKLPNAPEGGIGTDFTAWGEGKTFELLGLVHLGVQSLTQGLINNMRSGDEID